VRGGRETSDSHDDAVLSGLYQQVSERQEPRYAAGYDMRSGLDRYQSWLRKQGGDDVRRLHIPARQRDSLGRPACRDEYDDQPERDVEAAPARDPAERLERRDGTGRHERERDVEPKHRDRNRNDEQQRDIIYGVLQEITRVRRRAGCVRV